jgi:hypothetical protein
LPPFQPGDFTVPATGINEEDNQIISVLLLVLGVYWSLVERW